METAKHPSPSKKAAPTHRVKTLYVRVLLSLLPHLLNLTRRFSPKIQDEIDYLKIGYTFQLTVDNTSLICTCQKTSKGGFTFIPISRIASDVEAGSGLSTNQKNVVSIDYVITFRSIDFAFACFAGCMTLQEALAARAFSTRGPNNTGVALTYMFTALLGSFFFWRKSYRKAKYLTS